MENRIDVISSSFAVQFNFKSTLTRIVSFMHKLKWYDTMPRLPVCLPPFYINQLCRIIFSYHYYINEWSRIFLIYILRMNNESECLSRFSLQMNSTLYYRYCLEIVLHFMQYLMLLSLGVYKLHHSTYVVRLWEFERTSHHKEINWTVNARHLSYKEWTKSVGKYEKWEMNRLLLCSNSFFKGTQLYFSILWARKTMKTTSNT